MRIWDGKAVQRFWRPETGIFLVLWLILLVGGRSRLFQDPGTFWHTVVGEEILRTGEFPVADTFSFTFAGRPWIPHQWLGECVMALVHRVDGLDSLLLAAATLLSCLFTWMAARLIRSGLHWSLAMVIVGLGVAASSSHFHIRPHLGTMVLLGATVALLCAFEARQIGLCRLVWLVPLFMLWTNLHGGMLGGWGTLVLASLGWIAAWGLGWKSPLQDRREVLLLAGLVLACGLTAFVNPYGGWMPRIWLEIMGADLPEFIEEHAPLHWTRPEGITVLTLGVFYLAVLASARPLKPRVVWLLPLVWFYLACSRVRHSPLFAITTLVVLADLLPNTRLARWLARPGSDLFQFPSPDALHSPSSTLPPLLPLLLLFAGLVLQAFRIPFPLLGHGWARLDPDYWPVGLLSELKAREQPGRPIFNEYLFGGFLIYFTPGYRVFVDDRCELYGNEWLKEYVQAERGQDVPQRMEQWEKQYLPFDLALTRPGSGFDEYFRGSAAWSRIPSTSSAANLYQRGAPAAGRGYRQVPKI